MSGSVLTSASVVNRAAAQIGAQATVQGLIPNLTGGGNVSTYANILYQGVVLMILREQDWEFSRTSAALAPSGNAPLPPWQYEYLYPSDCVKVRQVTPQIWSANDPVPVEWTVAEHAILTAPTKVILCNVPGETLVYTTSNMTEAQWDSIFAEAVVRLLASELAMAIAGRPDLSKQKLGESGQLMSTGGGKDS